MRAYTHDMSRRPRLSREEQAQRLAELVRTKRALWSELLQRNADALERAAEIHDVAATQRSLRAIRSDKGRIEVLHRLATELAVAPGGIELAREIVAGMTGTRATQARWLCDAVVRLRSEVVQANLRLVLAVARKFISMHVHYEDMVADGNMGLLKAADRFDPDYKVMFSTYAIHWIRHEVGRGIDDRGRTVRVPVNARIVRRKIRQQRDLAEAQGRSIDDEEIAAACGIRVERLRQIDRDTAPVVCLDSVLGYGSELDRDDVADPADAADDALAQLEDMTALRALLPRLPKARAVVIRHRYGLDGAPELTLAEIGAKLGVSRERARQHQVAALEDLRAMLEHRRTEPRTIRRRRRPAVSSGG